MRVGLEVDGFMVLHSISLRHLAMKPWNDSFFPAACSTELAGVEANPKGRNIFAAKIAIAYPKRTEDQSNDTS